MSSEKFLDEKWIKKIDRETQHLIDRIGVDRKTLDEVFDKSTLLSIGKLISDRLIDYLDFPISTGKEANIFRGMTPNKKLVAVKIYRISTSTFKNISKYIEGDPRFRYIDRSRREIIYEWAKKEFKNLEILKNINVRAPTPIKRINNVLVMEYIGDTEKPAPLLKDVQLKDPKKIFNTLITFISAMYKKAGFVHADLSEYNILIHNNKPYIIDLSQGVLLEHPLSHEFLKRDIHNITRYFKKFNIKKDEKKLFQQIIQKKDIEDVNQQK
ncbi:MAG: serine protein kinase RIO [Thermoplasmata archaeon]|nr:MAG: serine protein kinase RIO [Thermoplasmata archaeon]